MKNMKSKLLASVAMLLVSAIMLTSASFAWFTISTAPEVKSITTTVVTNETLEIALNKASYTSAASVDEASTYNAAATTPTALTGNYYTWGNLVDLAATGNAATTAYAALDKTLRPATLAGTPAKFNAPTYGTDGRISGMLANGLAAVAATGAAADGFGLLIQDTDADGAYDAGEYVYGYYIDYWMRSNVGGQVTLAAATDNLDRDASTTTDNTGAGSTFTASNTDDDANAANAVLAANIRVAFQDVTPNKTAGAIVAATTTAAEGAETATFSGNVVELTANTAAKVRVFVYLEGGNVKNDAASIDGQVISGALNLQFTIASVEGSNAVDKSMLSTQSTVAQ